MEEWLPCALTLTKHKIKMSVIKECSVGTHTSQGSCDTVGARAFPRRWWFELPPESIPMRLKQPSANRASTASYIKHTNCASPLGVPHMKERILIWNSKELNPNKNEMREMNCRSLKQKFISKIVSERDNFSILWQVPADGCRPNQFVKGHRSMNIQEDCENKTSKYETSHFNTENCYTEKI